MDADEYLTAFDLWLSRYIESAMKAGKDLAFRDRKAHGEAALDDSGSAWDHLLLEPGAPSPGRGWTVYRLQGVAPKPAPADLDPVKLGPAESAPLQRRAPVATFVRTLFGAAESARLRVVS